MPATSSVVRRTPSSSSLYDVLDLILDKGLVIDAYVRVSLVGIEILTIDLRVVVASVDTYLRFAEAAERLHLGSDQQKPGLPQLVEGVGKIATKRKLAASARKLTKPVKKLEAGARKAKDRVVDAPKKAKKGLFRRAGS